MSFLNTQLNNDVSARFQKIMAEDIYQRNKETNEFERVGSSSGGEVELPSWVQNNSANFDNSNKNTKINIDGVEVNNQNKGSFLSEDKLTFGDTSGNVSLEKSDVQVLKDLQVGISTVPVSGSKILIYDNFHKKYTATSWRNYLNTTTIQLPTTNNNLTQISATNVALRSSVHNPGTGSILAHDSLVIGTRNAADFALNNMSRRCVINRDACSVMTDVYNYTSLKSSEITFAKSGEDIVSLQKTDVEMLKKFNEKVEAAATGDDRLITYNPSTKNYKLIEASSGGSVPTWAKTSEAEFVSGDRVCRVDYRGLSLLRDMTSDKTEILPDGMLIYRMNSGGAADGSKASTTIMRNSITLAENNATYTVLNYSRAKTLENLHNATSTTNLNNSEMIIYNNSTSQYHKVAIPTNTQKTYFKDIPVYSDGTSHVDVTSYFPRWATLYPNGPFWSGTPPTQRKFKLPIGDTIIFKSNVGMNGTNPSLYYDTWYCVAFSPDLSFVHPSIIFNTMSIEGNILETSFPYAIPDDGVQNSIDIRLAPSPANDGSIAFRINGTYAKVVNQTTSYQRKEPKDPFFGRISFTAKAYGGQEDIEEATLL